MLANLSASNITIGKAETRRLLCRSQSARCLAAYLYAAAGTGESTTDLAWDGQASIFENGALLAETDRFPDGDRIAMADIDLDLLRQERMRMGTFDDNRRQQTLAGFRRVPFRLEPPLERHRPQAPRRPLPLRAGRPRPPGAGLLRGLQHPGLGPGAAAARHRHRKRIVIGVSGGLDSTQALIVAAQALDLLELPRTNILAFTLPGFATERGGPRRTPCG